MINDSVNKYQTKILTIPNILSFFRLCLIPLIMWLYIEKQDYPWTLMILILSGVTDIADGIIARKYRMISDFGKVLDPIADKLTQIATLFCLVSRFPHMIVPLVLLVVKEVFVGIIALIAIRRTCVVKGAVWHGKLLTASLYIMMALHLLWYTMPQTVSVILIGVCIGIMIVSCVLYTIQNMNAIRNKSSLNIDSK